MASTIKIDKQGRIIIPKEIRDKLGLHNTDLKIHVIGNKIIIEPFNSELEQQASEWEKALKNLDIEAFRIDHDKEENESKWFSEGYAKQKLGL